MSPRNYYPAQSAALAGVTWKSSELVDIESLQVDFRYQRKPSERKIVTIAKAFDTIACGAIDVSRRPDGSLWVMDGNHRTEAARRVGVKRIRALVYGGLTLQEEAALFSLKNSSAAPACAKARFKADLMAGDPEAHAIEVLAQAAGLALDFSGSKRNDAIECFGALKMLYRLCGADALARALRLSVATWPNDHRGRDSMTVSGLTYLVKKYGDQFSDSDFIAKLAETLLVLLRQKASAIMMETRDSGERCFCIALKHAYNFRRRTNVIREVAA